MGVIQVQAPGLFTTVQDLGREGFGPMGVSPSGAADSIALRAGNWLVSNPSNAAGLEMTLLGGAFLFPQGGIIALTGSDFETPIPMWTSVRVEPGESLRIGPTRSGARCYLCIHGGIIVKPFLGSASTHVLSGLGGFEGRGLKKGDVLMVGDAGRSPQIRTMSPPVYRKCIRVTAGPQSSRFSESCLYDRAYRVTEEANRMGIRLEGPPIPSPSGSQMITEGVSLGAIQVPPGGQPIILFVEQQTTGGYPKIANVISADLPSVGQLRPRDEVRFELVGLDTALSLLTEQEKWFASLD
jgi:antagonist of KipI